MFPGALPSCEKRAPLAGKNADQLASLLSDPNVSIQIQAAFALSRLGPAAEPAIPTMAQSGLPGYEVTLWHGLAGPKGLPRPIVDRINAEVSAAMKSKEAAEQLQTDGVLPMRSTPEELYVTLRKEIELWRKVIHDAGITLQ